MRGSIDWGKVNRPIEAAHALRLWAKARAHAAQRELFVQDLHVGADPAHQRRVRIVTETAWHALFARNMFRESPAGELDGFTPDFTVLQLPSLEADPATDGTRSNVAIVLDFGARTVLICGTRYAGEIKKSIFTVLNYLLPDEGVFPMHCSANVGKSGDVAVFFGLSGTGKTTLSADPTRTLIGDDEHGWSARGVFNFEGGCYAKVIRLSPEDEPEIYAASTRFGAILENVVADPVTGAIDFDDDSLTENTRSSYPLRFIPNASDERPRRPSGAHHHADRRCLRRAAADQQAVARAGDVPFPVRLHGAGRRHRAGRQGAAGDLLDLFRRAVHAAPSDRLRQDAARLHAPPRGHCWLVNTGWSGGPYGTGERISLRHTRALLHAALEGKLANVPFQRHAEFGLMIPEACPGVPSEILDPKATWADPNAYGRTAREVAKPLRGQLRALCPHVGDEVRSAGIHVTA